MVKHRRTVTKPVVQDIFIEPQPKKSNLKKSKPESNGAKVEDNRVSTLIHMTSDHGEHVEKKENEYIEVLPREYAYNVSEDGCSIYDERHKIETVSVKSGDNHGASTAENLFFIDVEPVAKSRSRNFHLTDYGDTLSQSSQTSA